MLCFLPGAIPQLACSRDVTPPAAPRVFLYISLAQDLLACGSVQDMHKCLVEFDAWLEEIERTVAETSVQVIDVVLECSDSSGGAALALPSSIQVACARLRERESGSVPAHSVDEGRGDSDGGLPVNPWAALSQRLVCDSDDEERRARGHKKRKTHAPLAGPPTPAPIPCFSGIDKLFVSVVSRLRHLVNLSPPSARARAVLGAALHIPQWTDASVSLLPVFRGAATRESARAGSCWFNPVRETFCCLPSTLVIGVHKGSTLELRLWLEPPPGDAPSNRAQ